MSALKSQYEGRLSRQERELRELREQQERHGDQKDEAQEPGQSKVQHHKCPIYTNLCRNTMRNVCMNTM